MSTAIQKTLEFVKQRSCKFDLILMDIDLGIDINRFFL
jgi:hypothetical protein